jgi:hypothetical protein
MILKIIFNINFVSLRDYGGQGVLHWGRADDVLGVPGAPQMRFEGSAPGVSQQMKAQYSDGNSEPREEDEPR